MFVSSLTACDPLAVCTGLHSVKSMSVTAEEVAAETVQAETVTAKTALAEPVRAETVTAETVSAAELAARSLADVGSSCRLTRTAGDTHTASSGAVHSCSAFGGVQNELSEEEVSSGLRLELSTDMLSNHAKSESRGASADGLQSQVRCALPDTSKTKF